MTRAQIPKTVTVRLVSLNIFTINTEKKNDVSHTCHYIKV